MISSTFVHALKNNGKQFAKYRYLKKMFSIIKEQANAVHDMNPNITVWQTGGSNEGVQEKK